MDTNVKHFYINGAWVAPEGNSRLDVINPATEEACASIPMGTVADVNKAIDAASKAFETFSRTSVAERVQLLEAIVGSYAKRLGEMEQLISMEMGAPAGLAKAAQAPSGLGHFAGMVEILKNYSFQEMQGNTAIVKEPVGVCGFITPWNWPINQIACKVAPAIAAGCTMVLKPSEIAPLNAQLLAEIMHDAGVPAGVFNLVHGDGPTVGEAISKHEKIDMVSFTGSTRAGTIVAKLAADTVKRVSQELGGKSANIILDDADFPSAVAGGTFHMSVNTGQSCNAPSRMLVPANRHDEAVAIAKATAESVKVGDPNEKGIQTGPLASSMQFEKVQGLIQKGMDEGATLVTGGLGRPDGLNKGFYVRPTVFANANNNMTIAREEIFGPVLTIIPYSDEEDAISIANDTEYGLSGYVSSGDLDRARRVASRLRTGNVHLNGSGADFSAPFGGYKKSGNGREWGVHGLDEFLEVKAVMGYAAAK